MDDYTFQAWLDTAVRGIRFGPDRRAVRSELAGHLEDKAADLRRIFPDLTDDTYRMSTAATAEYVYTGNQIQKMVLNDQGELEPVPAKG